MRKTKVATTPTAPAVTLHLLVEPRMEPIPASLTVVEFDSELRLVDETTGATLVVGRHVAIGGPDEEIQNWLRPFPAVWVGLGAPALQHFTVMHIR